MNNHRFDFELMLAYVGVSWAIACASFIAVPSWRKEPPLLLAAVLFGSSVAFVTDLARAPDWVVVGMAIFATVTGPATVLKWQGSTLPDLLQDLKRVRDNLKRPPAGPPDDD